MAGKSVQLSHYNCKPGPGKHAVDIEMSTKNYKTLVKKRWKRTKGYRFYRSKIVGSGFQRHWKKVCKVAQKFLIRSEQRQKESQIHSKNVDGLVDVSTVITVENEGSPEMAAHSSVTFDEERKRCARN
jgi:hypothetical protein